MLIDNVWKGTIEVGDLVHSSWTDASFISIVTVGAAAQCVVLLKRKDLPPIPAIASDGLFQGLANLLLARDTVQRAEATVDGLCRPEDTDGRYGGGWAHSSYALVRTNASYNIDAALSVIEAGKRNTITPPSDSGGTGSGYLFPGMERQPLCGAGSFPGRHPPSGSAETSASTKALASRIYAALVAQGPANAAIDAGLAADVTVAFAARRAELLAIAEQWFPGVYV